MQTTYARDTRSQALINSDHQGLLAYKTRREKSQKLQDLERDINTVKSDLLEIKELLSILLVR